MERRWRWLRRAVLDPTDVAVAELARLHGDDLVDMEAMVDRGIVEHPRLLARFRSAAVQYGFRGMGHTLQRAIANLHRVERDVFMVPESPVHIPERMDR